MPDTQTRFPRFTRPRFLRAIFGSLGLGLRARAMKNAVAKGPFIPGVAPVSATTPPSEVLLGSLKAVFDVPEPPSFALVAIGLIAIGIFMTRCCDETNGRRVSGCGRLIRD